MTYHTWMGKALIVNINKYIDEEKYPERLGSEVSGLFDHFVLLDGNLNIWFLFIGRC